MRENVRLEFDNKLVTGDSTSADVLIQEVAESCEGTLSADAMIFRLVAVKFVDFSNHHADDSHRGRVFITVRLSVFQAMSQKQCS